MGKIDISKVIQLNGPYWVSGSKPGPSEQNSEWNCSGVSVLLGGQ